MHIFPGPPTMATPGHAEPLPARLDRLLAARDEDQQGGRWMTYAEVEAVVAFWNRRAKGRMSPWAGPGHLKRDDERVEARARS